MLAGRVSDLEMGGLMLAMRIKGESVAEIAGFLDAAEASFAQLPAPAAACAPIVIPSYNGSRQMPNLTPLLALLLARAGARVVVVDRGRYGTDTLSTHALMRGAVLQLHRWGVLPAIVEQGTPPVSATTFVYGNDEITVPIEPKYGVDALYAPRRTLLDGLLSAVAVESGAEVIYGVSVDGLLTDSDGRVRGVTASAGGQRHTI
jgi:hypothetical protein